MATDKNRAEPGSQPQAAAAPGSDADGAGRTVNEAPIDNERLANLCGALDANLRQIEEAFDVRIARRGNKFSYHGARAAVTAARQAIEHFIALAQRPLSLDDIQLGLVELKATQGGDKPTADDSPVLHTRRTDLQGRTPRQREYLRKILSHDVTFGTGPAGTVHRGQANSGAGELAASAPPGTTRATVLW